MLKNTAKIIGRLNMPGVESLKRRKTLFS